MPPGPAAPPAVAAPGGSDAALGPGRPGGLTACARPRGERRAKAAREPRCPQAGRRALAALPAALRSERSPGLLGTRCGGTRRGEGTSRKRGRLEEISSDRSELLSFEAFKKRLDVALGVLVIAEKVAIGHKSDLMILEVFCNLNESVILLPTLGTAQLESGLHLRALRLCCVFCEEAQ